MGNTNSGESSSKPPDKIQKCRRTGKVVTNTPYLKALFQKLALRSGEEPDANSNTYTRISQQVFENAFNGPLRILGKLLYTHIKLQCAEEERASIHLDEFLEVSSDIMSLITNVQQINYYFDMFSEGKDSLTIEGTYHMIQVTFAVSMVVAYLPFEQSSDLDKLLRSLAVGLMGPHDSLKKEDFANWCVKHIPHIFNGVHSFLLIKLSGAEFDDISWHQRMSQAKGKGNLSPASLAMIACIEDGGGAALSPCVLWLLSASLPNRYVLEQKSSGAKNSIVPNFLMSRLQLLTEKNAWCQLYCSNRDGLSVNRFEHHVFAYKGPTVTMFVFENNLYVLATECEWRESCSMWGGEGTVLLQLLPRFGFVDSGNIIYTNHHTRGTFKGIKIGSNIKSPIIKIADMSSVNHLGVELNLEQVEVWGCANTTIRDIQLKQRAWEKREVEKVHNRKLKLENWEENPDRMLLDWVGIKTNHHEKA